MKWTLLLAIATGCGSVHSNADANKSGDAPATTDAPRSVDAPPKPADADISAAFSMDGTWTCGVGVVCENVYDFDISQNSSVTASVTTVTAESVARLAMFAGTTTTGTNLLDNATTVDCAGQQDGNVTPAAITVATTGHYRVTVGHDNRSSGSTGTYIITVTTSTPFTIDGQTATNVTSMQANCPLVPG